jgi:hypothetical protein
MIVACMITLSLSGCKSMTDWSDKLPWSSKDPEITESAFQTPARMATIWVPDVMTQPNGKATRGFGGRFFFYNPRNEAVPVEGQLVVYAYDDTDKSQTTQTPSRKYVFTPEQFTTHFGKSKLGASYSVWISWDDVGGQEKSISLMPVFTTSSGHVVMGQQAMNVLPGKKVEVPMNSPYGQHGITQAHMTGAARTPTRVAGAAYQQPASNQQMADLPDSPVLQDAPQRNIRTTTITLPRTLNARVHEQGVSRRRGASTNGGAVIQQTSRQTSLVRPPLSTGRLAANQAAVDLANSMATVATQAGLQSASPIAHFGQPQYPAQALPNGRQGPALDPNQQNPSARRSALPWSRQRQASPSIPVTWSNAGRRRG